MSRSLAILSGAFAIAAAQTTTVGFWLPMFDAQDLQASVIGVKGEATTLALGCPNGADAMECGISSSVTIVAGKSTLSYAFDAGSDEEFQKATQAYICNMTPSIYEFTCTITLTGEMSGSAISSSTVASTKGSKSDYDDLIVPITVTAGANKLPDAAPASTTGVSKPTGTTSGAESTASDSDSESSSESTSATASGSDAASTPTETDNAAGPMVTSNAILAGVAAVVGGAAMLL